MTKIKIMNYDASEYKMLEADLNALASKGYTCTNIDYITFFKKDSQKSYYVTDIFSSSAKTQYSKRLEKDKWLSNYLDSGYQNIGKIRNIYVFKGKNKNKSLKETTLELLLLYFRGLQTARKYALLIFSIFISLALLPTVFENPNINEFVTDGAIIIRYIAIPICLLLLFRNTLNLYNNHQIKKQLKTNEKTMLINQDKNRKYRLYYMYTLLLTIVVLVLGISLDYFERKKEPINPNEVLTLTAFDIEGNSTNYPTYTVKNSILIPYSYSYFEQSGELDTESGEYGNLLSVNYYQIKDENLAKSFATNIIDYPSLSNASKIENLPGYQNVYLSYSAVTNIADSMIIVKDKTIIVVATSFDLTNPKYYQVILNFYLK